MKPLLYKAGIVESIDSLASRLGFSSSDLQMLAIQATSQYRYNPKPKRGGGIRETYEVSPMLAQVQEQILLQFFYDIEYPTYLQGSIKDFDDPRNYMKNVSIHLGAHVLIKEDIKNYFPSIKAIHVLNIWQNFCGFSKDVSELLTRLTTYRGFVPQGASTSSYIANLMFWDIESLVENLLRQHNFRYSRYVDDMTISATQKRSKADLTFVFDTLTGMLRSKHLKANRKKRKVLTAAKAMRIHGININARRLTLPKHVRDDIRAEIMRCERTPKEKRTCVAYQELYNRVCGRLNYLGLFHPQVADKYYDRLVQAEPIALDIEEVL